MRFDGQASRQHKKAMRSDRLSRIIVEVTRDDGTTLQFDGDEESQKRLDRFSRRARLAGKTELPWTMADNSSQMVAPIEMEQALDLAMEKQGEEWFL